MISVEVKMYRTKGSKGRFPRRLKKAIKLAIVGGPQTRQQKQMSVAYFKRLLVAYRKWEDNADRTDPNWWRPKARPQRT